MLLLFYIQSISIFCHIQILSNYNELHIDITCEYCDVISVFRPGFLLEEPLCKASFPFVAGKVQQPGQIALQGSSWTLVKCSKEGIRKGVSTVDSTDFNYCKNKPHTVFSSDDLIHGTKVLSGSKVTEGTKHRI